LEVGQHFFQKDLWIGQFWFVRIHILVPEEVPSSHLFLGGDVIDAFFKWRPPVFFLDSDGPFNCLNDSIGVLLSCVRKFLRKNEFCNEREQVKKTSR
jgi:hypothetical protein